MSSRREFIKTLSLGGAGLGLFPDLSGRATQTVKIKDNKNIGIITNTIGKEIESDFKRALREISDIGYDYVEGGVPEAAGDDYADFLAEVGLTPLAIGSSMDDLQDRIEDTLTTAESLGVEYVVCYWPWLSSAENLDRTEVMNTAERINELGKSIQSAGFRLAWHNHDVEFVEVDGEMAFDLLLQHTDPEYSTVELDWYWVLKAGEDPVEYFQEYPGRFEIAHVKDVNNNRDRGITCVGNGIVDFERIFQHSDTGGVEYFIVENERAVEGMMCARESYSHISNIVH